MKHTGGGKGFINTFHLDHSPAEGRVQKTGFSRSELWSAAIDSGDAPRSP